MSGALIYKPIKKYVFHTSSKIISESLGGSDFCSYLCSRLSEFNQARPPPDRPTLHEGHDIIKGVYLDALFLTFRNLANFYEVMSIARGRCSHDVITVSRLMLWRKCVRSYQCGFYACSFNLMGMREPRNVGQARV